MIDVAAAAGVSMTTVSHVLNNTRPVSDDARRRVLEAVEQTGYSPNMVARSLATRNSNVIGVVMSFLSNPFFGPLVSAIEKTAQRHGYTLLLSDNHEQASRERTQLQIMVDRQVDGVILAPVSSEPSEVIELLAKRQVPTVFIDRFAGHRFDDVGVENVEATATLVTHLAERGHNQIAFVSGKSGLSTTEERLAGYRLGLERAGLPFDRSLVRSGGSAIEPAYRAITALMQRRPAPTAVIPANNAMTVGTLRGLRDLGVQVPGDVALAAYDDLALADLMDPPLTAMAQPITEMGDLAAKLLFQRIHGRDRSPERHVLPATFQHRQSCGCTASTKTTS